MIKLIGLLISLAARASTFDQTTPEERQHPCGNNFIGASSTRLSPQASAAADTSASAIAEAVDKRPARSASKKTRTD